ncbi:MAG: UvrD-helicase domain-containing protein [Clostridia bacterium]|nr:UvrD-helicase domain-containing protein [Clostridia bacterium]
MKVYCNDRLFKQVHKQYEKYVMKILLDIAKTAQVIPVFDALKKYHNKIMVHTKNIWKFYTDSNHRVLWTFGRYLTGSREEEADDMFLLSYTDHDSQGKVAECISRDINRSNFFLINHEKPVENTDPGSFNVRLTNEQESFLRSQLPLMISGGAGNGKTLVALTKLFNLISMYGNKEIAYFTFTEGLKYNAKEQFEKIAGMREERLFHVINDHFLKTLSFSGEKLIQFEKFKEWFESDTDLKDRTDPMDVWVEIRGTIKGYMGKNWKRNVPFDIYLIREHTRKYLIRQGFITYVSNSQHKVLKCIDTSEQAFLKINQTIRQDQEENSSSKTDLLTEVKKIYDYQVKHEFKEKLIDIDEYLMLDDDTSQYSIEDKKAIYHVAVLYQQWIDNTGCYDDNDIAIAMIMKNREETETGKYDFLVIDEIQDLSEVQISAVLTMVRNRNNVVLSGDVHQIIQPTVFSSSRIRKLFDNRITIDFLKVNHRSQGEIVEFTNNLSALRRKLIGNRKIETEEREEAIWRDMAPCVLDHTRENVTGAVNYLKNIASAAMVVSDEREKEKLKEIARLTGPVANLYTVGEIKGLEWDYIFCYRLIGHHLSQFKDIFYADSRHAGRFRYYFNMLYVASTRARKGLCFCEDGTLYGLSDLVNLFEKTSVFNEFNPLLLNIGQDTSGIDEWEFNAARLEKQKVYDRAAMYYAQSGKVHEARRCEALHMISQNAVEAGISQLMDIGENEIAYLHAGRFSDRKMQLLAFLSIKEYQVNEIEMEFRKKEIIDIYLNRMLTRKEQAVIEDKYITRLAENLEMTLTGITEYINNETGGNHGSY